MKVYIVKYNEEGAHIGHGVYETYTSIDNIYISEEKANTRVEELKQFGYYAWVDDMIVIE